MSYRFYICAVLIGTLVFGRTAPLAHAFDPAKWSLFKTGSGPSTGQAELGLSYTVEMTVAGGGDGLRASLLDASGLAGGASKPIGDMGVLIARARGDEKVLRAALYEEGYYAGKVRIFVAGVDTLARATVARPETPDTPAAAATGPVPVRIEIEPGALFRFGRISVTAKGSATPPLVDPRALGLIEGEVARSGVVVGAIKRLLEEWRIAGHPLAQIARKAVVADHSRHALDVDVEIDPGPAATYGWVNVTGATDLSGDLVARYSGLVPGRGYNARDLRKATEKLRKLEAIESVTVVRGDELDANGGIPLTLNVTERKARFFGASAALSTLDGGELQAYWGHRNLFGGSEKLRVEGGVSQIGDGGLPALQYAAKAALTKPAAFDVNTDLQTEIGVVKERPESYESRAVTAKLGAVHRFSETRSGSLFIAGLVAREEDAFGRRTDVALSLPAEMIDDRRDNKLDPTAGWRSQVVVAPTYDLNEGTAFLTARAGVSSYLDLTDNGRAVLAGRIAAGGIFGANAADILPSQRLYAGGGGSVRGYAYRSIAPALGDAVIGGSALLEASAEFRWRVTPTIGLVPFLDAGVVTDGAWSSLSQVKLGAGLGLRYYTGLGPIRIDVAVPLDDDPSFSALAFYVGLGQAF
ncbi:MAG: autotransporter assembly complex family protein [Hyphomicrobiaceae bacterium]